MQAIENDFKTKVKFVLISCCTYKRADVLNLAFDSIKNLNLPSNDIEVGFLVVDNDKDGSAQAIVEKYQKDFPIKIYYAIEEKRGLSNARNKLLNEALKIGASHILMFDDDEVMDKNWLVSHLNYYNENINAHVVSGPIYTKFDKKYPKYIENNFLFKRTGLKTGTKRDVCPSNNVFFPTIIMSRYNIFFDPAYVFMGGEDGDFFGRVSQCGFNIISNNEAWGEEVATESRANVKWILNRAYYNGYSCTLLDKKVLSLNIRDIFYFIKKVLEVLVLLIALPFALFSGLTGGVNALALLSKNIGKVAAMLNPKSLNYYKNLS